MSSAPHQSTRRIEFTDHSVIKWGAPEAIAIEAAKTRSAHELGRSSGLFRAPSVLSHDAAEGRLEQERVLGYASLQRMAAYGPADHPVWQRIGASLALIHDELEPAACPHADLPPSWQASDDAKVWIHGDFNLVNVCYSEDEDAILILDWSLTPMLDSFCAKGPAEFDVAWMLRSLFFLPIRLVFARGLEEKADRFLAGYMGKSRRGFADNQLSRLSLASAKLMIDKQVQSRLKRIVYARFAKRLARYVNHGLEYRRHLP